jgi:hypothetical protein
MVDSPDGRAAHSGIAQQNPASIDGREIYENRTAPQKEPLTPWNKKGTRRSSGVAQFA